MGKKGDAKRQAKAAKKVIPQEPAPMCVVDTVGSDGRNVIVAFSNRALHSMKNGKSVPIELVDGEVKRKFIFMRSETLKSMKEQFAAKAATERTQVQAEAEKITNQNPLADEESCACGQTHSKGK